MRPRAPRSEVRGVRSSWLTVEMNSSFMRSRAWRSETSWKAMTIPMTTPLSSCGRATYSTGKLEPSLRQKTSSMMRMGMAESKLRRMGQLAAG